MEFTRIKYIIDQRIATITLSRPEKHNVFDNQLVLELTQAFIQTQKDTTVRTIILRAEGDSFCEGTDPTYLQQISKYDFNQNLQDSSDLMKLFLQIYTSRKPVIGLVQGAALAEGCGLATVCDFVIAARETVKFGYTEVSMGSIPATVLLFLVRRIGEGRAREFVLRGNIVDAEEALKIGLISAVVPAMELDRQGILLARELNSHNSGSSMGLVKELLSRAHGMTTNDALEYASNLNALTRMTDDSKRGIEARLKKEDVQW